MVLQEFIDVFLKEMLGLVPKREIYFTIDLVPIVEPIYKTPYRMSTIELMDKNVIAGIVGK